MTREEWYAVFDSNREVLSDLVRRYYPIGSKSSPDVPITAGLAERACEAVRSGAGLLDILDLTALLASTEFSWELLSVLSGTWFGMPENLTSGRDRLYEDGFYTLCELCEGVDEDFPDDYDPD